MKAFPFIIEVTVSAKGTPGGGGGRGAGAIFGAEGGSTGATGGANKKLVSSHYKVTRLLGY
jgi:hypothetical protein